MVNVSICSYSFHRLLGAGRQDVLQFIRDCWVLGCAELDPWNGHMPELKAGDAQVGAGTKTLSDEEEAYVARIRAAGDGVGLPFGTIAVDGAYIFDADADKMRGNRLRAYRWLDIAARLGAKRMRVDAGGPEELTSDILAVITAGYADLVARGKDQGIEIVIENHWGSSIIPENVVRILDGTPGLGLLLDTGNWKAPQKEEGRRRCAPYATATHIKTFAWDEQGNEIEEHLPEAIAALRAAGYQGIWGVESVPRDGNEMAGVRNTIGLIQRCLSLNSLD